VFALPFLYTTRAYRRRWPCRPAYGGRRPLKAYRIDAATAAASATTVRRTKAKSIVLPQTDGRNSDVEKKRNVVRRRVGWAPKTSTPAVISIYIRRQRTGGFPLISPWYVFPHARAEYLRVEYKIFSGKKYDTYVRELCRSWKRTRGEYTLRVNKSFSGAPIPAWPRPANILRGTFPEIRLKRETAYYEHKH